MSAWEPGDVAMVKFAWQVNSEPLVCMRAEHLGALGWLHPGRLGGFTSDQHPAGPTSVHPLALIDPESREQVERLAIAYTAVHNYSGVPWGEREQHSRDKVIADLQAALREFAKPEPPKPEEPTGLGAVVRDRHGTVWVQTPTEGSPDCWEWVCTHSTTINWDAIEAVEVLSAGWSE